VFVLISYWTDTQDKTTTTEITLKTFVASELWILLRIYWKVMLAIEIELFVYLSFLLQTGSFMAFNNN